MKKKETYTKIHGQTDQLSKDIYESIKAGKSYGKYISRKNEGDDERYSKSKNKFHRN